MTETTSPAPPKRKSLRRRILRLCVFGLVAVVATLAWIYFFYCFPVGSGPAGPPVPRESFAKPWTTRKALLLGLGDSVTTGFGVTPPYSYFNRLMKNPKDEFEDMKGLCLSAVLPNLKTRNEAVSGSTSPMHLETIRKCIEKQPDDVFGLIVMTSGGNDLMHNHGRTPPCEGAMYGATFAQAEPWIGNYEKRLHAMIELLRERFPGGCMIFLADIYDPSDGVGNPARVRLPDWPDCMAIHRAYNAAIRRCAERYDFVHIVPMHEEFLGHGIHCTQPWRSHYRLGDPHYWYGENLEDPNSRGYDAIRRLFLLEIIRRADVLASMRP
jgi:lysophospholipase L1-like esterase